MLPSYVQQQIDDYRARAQRAENEILRLAAFLDDHPTANTAVGVAPVDAAIARLSDKQANEDKLEEYRLRANRAEYDRDFLATVRDRLSEQVDRLARFILDEVEGYPCEKAEACDTAIRIICDLQQASVDCPVRCRSELSERLARAEELLRQHERTALRAQGLYTALKAKLREALK